MVYYHPRPGNLPQSTSHSVYNVLADVLYTQHRLTCNTSYLFVKNCMDPPLSTEVVNGHRKCELLDLGKWQLIRTPVRVPVVEPPTKGVTSYQGRTGIVFV